MSDVQATTIAVQGGGTEVAVTVIDVTDERLAMLTGAVSCSLIFSTFENICNPCLQRKNVLSDVFVFAL